MVFSRNGGGQVKVWNTEKADATRIARKVNQNFSLTKKILQTDGAFFPLCSLQNPAYLAQNSALKPCI